MTVPSPRPHQVAALADLTTALAVHDRTQLVMACGTGKTLVGRWHAQASDARTVLVLLPSLALVAQTLREWRRAQGNVAMGWRFSALVVCSDPTTSAGVAERGDEDAAWTPEKLRAEQVEVTTDPRRATRFLRTDTTGPRVVFSTYHSSPVVAAAQAATETRFDLVICDEAHRLAGNPSETFATVLDNRRIVARKRLFMTATPKTFTGTAETSMDDPRHFGPVAHTVSFGDAIAAGLLTDYRVVVVAGHRDAVDDGTGSTVPGVLAKAIDDYRLRRVLSFHGRVAKASSFATALDGRHTHAGTQIHARHVSGAMPTADRTAALTWLGETGPGTRMVTNARCLSEGVDVPSIDGILFADKRSSLVDIIQAIGRVLRPAPGKSLGTIVLPVELTDDGDDDTSLALSSHAAVWTVLRALRAHDQRFADDIDAAVRRSATGHHGGFRIPRINFVFPDGVALPDLQLRIVQELGSIWERNYALLQQWADHHGGRLMPRNAKSIDGTINLGEWAEQQRILRRRGLLDTDRTHRLEATAGWSWDKADSRWRQTLEILQRYASEHGTVADHHDGQSRFAGMYDADTPRRHLGVWMATQRQAHRLGTLNADYATALEALPGWSWDGGLPAVDVDHVEALRQFVEFEKHAGVPDDHVEDGLRLGAWCWAVRRRWLNGRLSPTLHDEIIAATPSRDRPSVRWQWEKIETQWRLGYFALRTFVEREGCCPTGRSREQLPDVEVNVGQWSALQRLKHRRGELDARHVELLEGIAGWQWEVELQRVEAQEPVDLPPTSSHGTPGAYSNHKCRCGECLDWRRQADRDRLARKRQPRDPVPVLRARRHLESLETAFMAAEKDTSCRNGRTLIAAVSGVSLGTIRKILRGTATAIEREEETRLLATTFDMVMDSRNQAGSRGRATSRLTARVDSTPMWEQLDDLAARGFGITWVSRELGYSGAMQVQRGRAVAARIADAVADLHSRVGDLVMPDLAKSARRPDLATLLTEQRRQEAS